MLEYVKEYLKINEVEYKENLKLSRISPVKIGGEAAIASYPKDKKSLLNLVSFLRRLGCKHRVFGKTSNVLFMDSGYDGVAIFTDKLNRIKERDGLVYAECGIGLPSVSRFFSKNGISGFEELAGIPGSVGASVVGNAGAFGREVSDLLVSAKIYYPDIGETLRVASKDIEFGYRESNLKKTDCLILSCLFRGKASSKECVERKTFELAVKRRNSQPYNKPSLGSTFKRPKNDVSAGALIDACGLKGYSVGGAAISDKHAGFVINVGGASSEDYLAVAHRAELAVLEKFNIRLEKEIEMIE